MPHPHAVCFYKDGASLQRRVVAYGEAGLSGGDSVIVIARPPILTEVQQRWLPGFQDRCIGLDAKKTLSRFMVNDMPNRRLFFSSVGELVKQAAGRTRHVYAFGEMVALLWQAQNFRAVIRLEQLWTELGSHYPMTLLCAYPKESFPSGTELSQLRIIEAHSDVIALP